MEKTNLKIAFISSYLPRRCGLATFTNSLIESFENYLENQVKVVAISDANYSYSPRVIFEIEEGNKNSYLKAANLLNASPIESVVLEHEYGIFGGKDGSYILDFLENINKPIVTSFHSVLKNHDRYRYDLTQKIINLSNSVVVMTKSAKNILVENMNVDPQKIFVVKHGVPNVRFDEKENIKEFLGYKNKIIFSTFGLLNRGKGIELAISTIENIKKEYPNVLYLIIGVTHPAILKKEGEKYRKYLTKLIKEKKLEDNIRFINNYLDYQDLVAYLKATDIYMAPQLDLNQSFSGTISYALGCGCAVISSPTIYAQEILADSRGIIVPLDSEIMSSEILKLLKSPDNLRKLALNGYRFARTMIWPHVGLKYLQIVENNLFVKNDGWVHRLPNFKSPPPIKHFNNITSSFGIYQHCKGNIPNKDFGYSLDDQVRALIVCEIISNFKIKKMGKMKQIFISFLKKAVDQNGIIHNFFSDDEKFIDKKASSDSVARSFWALSLLHDSKKINFKSKLDILKLIKIYQKNLELEELRPLAYALLGYCNLKNKKEAKELADKLVAQFKLYGKKDWAWFENELTWANAILILSLCKAYRLLKNSVYLDVALKTLSFLEKSSCVSDYPSPIGQKNWFKKDHSRSIYDQQPIEAADMVILFNELFDLTGEKKYKDKALLWFGWYFGNNLKNMMIFDPVTEGVYDGLTKNGVNKNQGAESIVTYLMAYLSFNKPI